MTRDLEEETEARKKSDQRRSKIAALTTATGLCALGWGILRIKNPEHRESTPTINTHLVAGGIAGVLTGASTWWSSPERPSKSRKTHR